MFNLLIISSFLILTVNCQRDRLLSELMRGASDKMSILPDNATESTQVKIGVSLINIVDFDYERQEIEIRIWLQMEWTEKRLRWDPAEYGGISTVRLNSDLIPKPDMKLYNGDMKIDDDVLLVVSSDGTIVYIPPVHITAQCPQTQHHQDQITCTFKLGSWAYDGSQLQLKSNGKTADSSNLNPGWRWNLIAATTQVEIAHYACCPEPYPHLNFTLQVLDKSKSDSWSLF